GPAMRYLCDRHNGRINPKYFDFGLHVNRRAFKVADFLRNQVVSPKDVNTTLDQTEPSLPAYRRTAAALQHYLELAKRGDGTPILVSKKSIKPGAAYDGVS